MHLQVSVSCGARFLLVSDGWICYERLELAALT